MAKYGPVLSGSTVVEFSSTGIPQTHLILPPIVFFVRRFIFVICMIYLDCLMGQIIVQMTLTMLVICMMLDRRRIESNTAYVTEIINEIIVVILSYIMMGYGVYVLDGSTQNTIGSINIFVLFLCIGINFIILIFNSIKGIYRWIKYKFCYKPCVLRFKAKYNLNKKGKMTATDSKGL